jgi:hypothetical protein
MQIVVIIGVVKIVGFKRSNFQVENCFMEATPTSKPPSKFRLNSVAFLLAVLLFFLPFVNIKCKGQNLVSNNGIGLAFGTNYKTSKQIQSDEGNTDKKISFTEKDSGKMYLAALIALLLGVAGFVLSILNPGPNKINAAIGVLAALALIVLMLQIKYDVRDKSGRDITEGFSANLKITAEFTAWYYLSLISFIAAAFFSYRRKPIVISG